MIDIDPPSPSSTNLMHLHDPPPDIWVGQKNLNQDMIFGLLEQLDDQFGHYRNLANFSNR